MTANDAERGKAIADSGKYAPPPQQDPVPHDDDDIRSGEHSGQVLMAQRLTASHTGCLLYVNGIGWHYWDGKRWAVDDTGHAQRAVIQVLKEVIAETVGAPKGR